MTTTPRRQRFVVISPDGLPTTPHALFSTETAAQAELMAWCRRYEAQGYYAAASGERIALADLPSRCTITRKGA